MSEAPTLAELLAAVIVLFGLGISLWALVDDAGDMANVWRYGEIGGPRWVSAQEHFLFNGSLLVGWLCLLGTVSIAIYLPTRTDQPGERLSEIAGWLRFGFSVAVFVAQVHRRVGRTRLKNLPLDSWERMLASMFDGMSIEQRAAVTSRLLQATSAGREMGHLIRNEAQVPVSVLDDVANDPSLPDALRARAAGALDAFDRLLEHADALHAQIKAQEPTA